LNSSDPRRILLAISGGIAAYKAPEQIETGEAVDGRADCYSAGCMLVVLLSNQNLQ
jgi:hypothetical protein